MILAATITAATATVARGRHGVRVELEAADGRRFPWSATSLGRIAGVYQAAGIPRSLPPASLVGKRVSLAIAQWGETACVIAVLSYFAEVET